MAEHAGWLTSRQACSPGTACRAPTKPEANGAAFLANELGDAQPFENAVLVATRPVECGGLPPLFAARACPGVLHAFVDASDRARRASPEYSGSKLPHSTCAMPLEKPRYKDDLVGARYIVPGANAWR
jgi:hypothetical protein